MSVLFAKLIAGRTGQYRALGMFSAERGKMNHGTGIWPWTNAHEHHD